MKDKREAFMRMRHAGWHLVNQMQVFNRKIDDLTQATKQFRRVIEHLRASGLTWEEMES